MKKGVIISAVFGVAVVAAAGYLSWNNLAAVMPNRPAPASSPEAPPAKATATVPAPRDGSAKAEANERGNAVAANDRGGPSAAVGRGAQPHPVKAEKVTRGSLRTYVKLTGEVEAANLVNVFPEVAGKVDEINVYVGSRVNAQTVLLTVDPSRPGTRYEPNPVRSPINGTVIDILVKKGQSVTTGTPTVKVATISDLELSVRVPERFASIVSWQSVARVSFEAAGGAQITATVKRLQPVIDPISRSKEVVFAIPPRVGGIEPGMFGSVELTAENVSNAVIVPFEAIVQEVADNYVYLAQDGKAVKRAVDVGLLAGEKIQILSGLSGGELVITTGQTFLEDGSPIQVVGQGAGSLEPAQPQP